MNAETKRIIAEEELMAACIRWAHEHRDAESREAIGFAEWYAGVYPNGDKSMATAFDYWETLIEPTCA